MNTWIRLACLAALTVTLAACAREDQPRADGAQTSAEAGAEAASAAAAKSLKKPLAKNVDLGFRYHLRSDRVQEDKPGVFRRKVLVEYLGLDQQQAASALIADMVEGGYTVASERTDEQGRIRLPFQKGKRKITARVRHGGKLEHASATGAILVSLPAKAPKAARKDAEPAVASGQSPD